MTILEEIKTNTQQRNAAFAAMTTMEKRVAIAQDVLKWIDSGILLPTPGTYFGQLSAVNLSDPVTAHCEIQPHLINAIEQVESCECCAKGMFFIAKVAGFDGLKFGGSEYTREIYYPDEESDAMRDMFGNDWNDIEIAFEAWVPFAWLNDCTTPEQRLRAICAYIIEHDGAFNINDWADQFLGEQQ